MMTIDKRVVRMGMKKWVSRRERGVRRDERGRDRKVREGGGRKGR